MGRKHGRKQCGGDRKSSPSAPDLLSIVRSVSQASLIKDSHYGFYLNCSNYGSAEHERHGLRFLTLTATRSQLLRSFLGFWERRKHGLFEWAISEMLFVSVSEVSLGAQLL